MFAIIEVGGKQFTVEHGDTVDVDKLQGNVGDVITVGRVLLTSDNKSNHIGTPTVKGAKVTAKILAQKKGEKIDVRRFKSKVRQRRHIGFRPHLTTVEITAIATA
ncbi:50S ribosomal protein L21 [Candidatus Gottesmanbacteria bacterium]|nr:50S ribosomal protein L21 [Candidatus Gottesmanbacteria bacterium]